MYQDFFNLTEFPFNQFPNTEFYYNLENHQKSLDVLMVGLQVNDGIIKITGEPGTGKSMLCRFFIEQIAHHDVPVYVMNPYFTYAELLQSIATELKLTYKENEQSSEVLKLIYNKAQILKAESKKLVLLFDEAQYLSRENLEIIQILGNLECSGEKLCQIVLIGSSDLDDKLKGFNHFLQRISFSYTLLPIDKKDVNNYVFHRLNKATKTGKKHDITLSPQAAKLLYNKTKGIPRLINIVCHKALMLAYSRSEHHISKALIQKALVDTEYTSKSSFFDNFLSSISKMSGRVFPSMKNKDHYPS